jgi:pyruvate dehydrogenase E1 component beta subunit
MATEILMPALSPTMEEGTLAKWLVKEGDTVSAGDILAEIETDKATMEFEAVDEGIIGKILVAEGTEGVKVNSPIAILVEEGEDVPETGAPRTAKPPPPPSRWKRRRQGRPGTGRPSPPPPLRNPTPPPTGPPMPRWSRRRSARRSAMPWPKRCAATTPSS